MLVYSTLNPVSTMNASLLLPLLVCSALAAPSTPLWPMQGASFRHPVLAPRSNAVYSVLEAAAAGDAAALEARLAAGENPSQRDELGNSPLHYAAQGNSVRVLQLLLEAGADTAARDALGRTPRELCRHASLMHQLELAEARRLRELEADALIARGDEAGLRKALAAGVSPDARSEDNEGFLLLHAVMKGHAGMVSALLEAGAKVNAVTVERRQSALHLAAGRGDTALIRQLLEAGADPMLQTTNGAYALHDAVWARRLEAVRVLLPAYASVNFSPKGGPHDTPLNMAIVYGRDEYVQAFLEAGFNPNDARLKGEPPLILAVRHEREGCVRLLLEAGADKQTPDGHGKTAMDYATASLVPLLR